MILPFALPLLLLGFLLLLGLLDGHADRVTAG